VSGGHSSPFSSSLFLCCCGCVGDLAKKKQKKRKQTAKSFVPAFLDIRFWSVDVMQFGDLAKDNQRLIFSFFSVKDLGSVCRVCRAWYNLAFDDRREHLDFSTLSKKVKFRQIAYLFDKFPRATSVNFRVSMKKKMKMKRK
jgi:hypothetical protein